MLIKRKELKSARDWHIYHVYRDIEFINACKHIDVDTNLRIRQKIAKEYSISLYDVFYFLVSNTISLGPNIKRKGSLTFDLEKKKYILTFDGDISKSEFIEFWQQVNNSVKVMSGGFKTSKRKPPENPNLIYAIFKSRKKHTFKEIYEQYSRKKLPLYSGSTNQFKDEESLERYYNKFRPDA